MDVYPYTLQIYSFKRPPNEAEWDILRSYTRRIWHISGYSNPDGWLNNDSLIAICTPSVTAPLFPNLRTLYWQGCRSTTMIPAVHIAVPSLSSLHLNFTPGHVPALKDFLDTLGTLCPNIQQYRISIFRPHIFDNIICSHIRQQTGLRSFRCGSVIFDADTISHLSRMPSLTHLSFTQIPNIFDRTFSFDAAPDFSTLTHLEMGSESLERVTALLSYARLPVVEDLNVKFSICPSKEAFKSSITTIQNVCSSNSLARLELRGTQSPGLFDGIPGNRLILDDIRPCMEFVNFRHVNINLEWSIDLTDSDLLAMVSAWPHIRSLLINNGWGWRTTVGITLQGVLQLLQKRRSLSELCIAIHTDSFVKAPHGFKTGLLPPPSLLTLNLADSPIRQADVPTLADVFVKLGLRPHRFSAWSGTVMESIEGGAEHRRLWRQVFERVMAESVSGERG